MSQVLILRVDNEVVLGYWTRRQAFNVDQTTPETAARFEIHLTKVNQWKGELLDNATTGVFEGKSSGRPCTTGDLQY